MDAVLTAADWLSAPLFAVALAMVAFGRPELRAAGVMIILSAGIAAVRWMMWGMITDEPWWIRGIVGAIVGGAILAGVPALWDWTHARAMSVPVAVNSSEVAPADPIQPDNVQPGLTMDNVTISNVGTAISAPKGANIRMQNIKIENATNGIILRDPNNSPK